MVNASIGRWLSALLCVQLGACAFAEYIEDRQYADAASNSYMDAEVFEDAGPGQSASSGREPSCLRAEFPAQPLPMEVLLLVDSSPFRLYDKLYDRLRTSIVSFVDRLQPGIALGLQVYPAQAFQERCDPSALGSLLVEMQPAPGVASEVNAVLAKLAWTAATHADHPMRPILVAALEYFEARIAEDAHLGRVPVERAIVIATQGTVFGCGEPALPLQPLLREALESLGIPVHFLGLNLPNMTPYEPLLNLPQLDALARASGSERAYLLGSEADETLELAHAIHAARRRTLSCRMALPRIEGVELDLSSLSVLFDTDQAEGAQRWPLRATQSECDGGKDGVFLSEENPEVIELCPASCAIARSASARASLRVAADCVATVL